MFEAMKYTTWYALGEFVDNAITSWLQNREELIAMNPDHVLRISIDFDDEAGEIRIADNAGGIGESDWPRAMKTASPPQDQRFLSIHGVGMKAAALWWGRSLRIESAAIGESVRRSLTVDLEDIDANTSFVDISTQPATPLEHGTVITITRLSKNLPAKKNLWKVRSYLASMYRNFLLRGEIQIFLKGTPLEFEYPEFLVAPYWPTTAGPIQDGESKRWTRQVSIELESGKTITGWIGLLSKGSTAGAGLLLTFHSKAIMGVGAGTDVGEEYYRPREIFGGNNSYRRQRLVGEFDVSAFGKSITSDAVNWEDDEEEEFLAKLRHELQSPELNILDMAENYRSTDRRKEDNDSARSAVSQVAKALADTMVTHPSLITDYPTPMEPREGAEVVALAQTQIEVPIPGGARVILVNFSVERAGDADWLSLYANETELTVRVNEEHPFMLSFAQIPRHQIEPVLRLALGLGVAERVDPDHVRTRLNALLRGPLAAEAGLVSIDE